MAITPNTVEGNLVIEKDLGTGVIELRLNRPKHLNAFNSAMYLAAAAALNKHSTSKNTRMIVLTAKGDSFCSGMDIQEASDMNQCHIVIRAARVFMAALMNCPRIVIAAVFGNVTGIGVTLLFHCDVVFAHTSSVFETPFSAVGIIPEYGSSILFPKFLGASLTSRLLLRGERVTATVLERAGCLHIVQSQVHETAADYALSWSRDVENDQQWSLIEIAKRIIRDPIRSQVRMALEIEFQAIDKLLQTGTVQRLMSARLQAMKKRRAML